MGKGGLAFHIKTLDQNDQTLTDFGAAYTQLRPSALALNFS